jgi:two-component system, LytTR family, sensor kinase
MNLSSRWWFALAVWPVLALGASMADWAWRRHGFWDELGYHLFGDACLAIAVMAVPFVLQRQRRRPEHLQALEAQIHPHFLFNTLNSIATLMHEDVDAADEMMASLGTLLRRTMDQDGAVEIPLKEELEILGIYLDIQRTRYADRLTTGVTADPESLTVLVPRLILQPIVENAVRHGISRRAMPGRIEVRARCDHDTLHVTVINDGAGWPKHSRGGGLGLKNTRARLRQFDRRCTFDLREGGDRGALAEVAIPVRR